MDQTNWIAILFLGFSIIILVYLRFSYPEFRYWFDAHFNGRKEHISYLINENDTKKYTIPLPPNTAFAYKTSDTACTYYTYANLVQFFNYYRNMGYEVEDAIVTSKEGNKFKIMIIYSGEGEKGNFISIDFVNEQ